MGRSVDDTAANGLRLVYCNTLDWNDQKVETIFVGDIGDWGRVVRCDPEMYIVGM